MSINAHRPTSFVISTNRQYSWRRIVVIARRWLALMPARVRNVDTYIVVRHRNVGTRMCAAVSGGVAARRVAERPCPSRWRPARKCAVYSNENMRRHRVMARLSSPPPAW